MKLKSFSYFFSLLIVFFYSPILAEEKIDIWKNQDNKIEIKTEIRNKEIPISEKKIKLNPSQTITNKKKDTVAIKIEEGASIELDEQKVFGIYDPANYDFNLNMWSSTKAEDLRSSIKRLNKINLSNSSKEILEAILFSFSYPPQGMTEKEFVDLN